MALPKKKPISVGNINIRKELLLTFSSEKSRFSSKKIERFIIFVFFLTMTAIYMIMNIRTMEAWDFVEITALWLGFAGFNSIMTHRDRKLDVEQSEATSDEEGDISR